MPLLYRLGLLVVAVTMVLLPLIYIGLIVLAGYGVYWHAVHDVGMLSAGRGRGKVLVAALYITPIIAGGVLILFMIKPLFAGRGRQEEPRVLARANEPLLFAFVEQLCHTVGAPAPSEIRVDSQVNASASFRHGFWSLFTGDLVLTIGMPVAAGLTLQQLTGVLAHEFGHFAQSTGMRLTYLIRSINAWFARVVYERDSWDETLTEWSENSDYGILLYLARFFVWLTRKILWVLMMTGHAISCFMLRQMEYDADRYECRVAGSESFVETMQRVTLLSVSNSWAHSNLKEAWNEGRLADDLPAYIQALSGRIPAEVLKKIEKSVREGKTSFFDTHPCDTDRIKAAREERATGFFHLDQPAVCLFSDFKTLSRIVSFDFYRSILGKKVREENLRPVSNFLERQEKEEQEDKAVARYFQRQVSPLRPLALTTAALPAAEEPQALALGVKSARERMLRLAPDYAQSLKLYSKARAKEKREELGKRLEPLESAASERLARSLQLLQSEAVAGRVDNLEALRKETAQLLPVLEGLNTFWPALLELRLQHNGLMDLLEQFEQKKEDQNYVQAVISRTAVVREKWRAVKTGMPLFDYPFEHASGRMSIVDFLMSSVPPPDDIGGTIESSAETLKKSFTLYFRVLGRLVLAAEAVEQALGLPALPEPQPEPDEDDA